MCTFTAPNALSLLKSKIKAIVKGKKKEDKPTEAAKTEDKPVETVAKPTEAAAAEAATDPVAAAARMCFLILPCTHMSFECLLDSICSVLCSRANDTFIF